MATSEFLWDLLKVIPAAQGASGREDETANDLSRVSALLSDAHGRRVRARWARRSARSTSRISPNSDVDLDD